MTARRDVGAAGTAGEVAAGTVTSPAPRRRRPRDIGTAGETAVVRYLAANGFPHAERRSLKGALDCGDVTGTPGICWEIKAGAAAKTASDGQVAAWLAETERERVNARADVGVLVLQRGGIGAPNAGRWWAVLPLGDVADLARPLTLSVRGDSLAIVRMYLADVVALLRRAGYGDAVDLEQCDVPDDGSDEVIW